ncbi:hypothetical protein D3C87_1423610 [compost metagenome]
MDDLLLDAVHPDEHHRRAGHVVKVAQSLEHLDVVQEVVGLVYEERPACEREALGDERDHLGILRHGLAAQFVGDGAQHGIRGPDRVGADIDAVALVDERGDRRGLAGASEAVDQADAGHAVVALVQVLEGRE